MPDITVRGLSNELHAALRAQAKQNGRSMESEVRSILESHVKLPENPLVELYPATREHSIEIPLPKREVEAPRVDFSE